MKMTLHSFSDSANYNPIAAVPVSTWLCRRDVIERFGGWKPATQVYESSSQEWLYRIWKGGAKMRYKPLPGLILIPSSLRGTDYKDRHFEDQAYYAERIVNPFYRETELAKIASSLAGSGLLARLSPVYHLKTFGGFCYRLLAQVFMRIGIPMSPRGLIRLFKFGRRGNFIQNLRRRRGLSAIDPITQENYVFEFQESPDSHHNRNS